MQSITRKELYDLIWSKPVSKISKETNIKESVIRGLCVTYKIPLPINGYWSKIQFGKEVEVFPFIDDFAGSDIINLQDFETKEKEREVVDEIIEVKVDEEVPILNYPSELEDPLEVIIETRKRLTRKDSYTYYQSMNDDVPYVSVDVTSNTLDRALLFLDTLLKQIIKRGHKVDSKKWGTNVEILNQRIPIRIRESYNRVKRQNPKWYDSEDKVPNGILIFQIEESYRKVEWKDSATVKLEDKIPSIISKFEETCYKRYEDELESIREDIRKREIYKHIQARKKVVQVHLDKFNKLLRESEKYSKVLNMKLYINELKKQESNNEDIKKWIEWSTLAIDWYDPTVNYEHPYLKDVDRDVLVIKSLDRDIENWYDFYNKHKYGYEVRINNNYYDDEDDEFFDYND